MIESESDEYVIDVLNIWLEDWLWRRDCCPNCGVIE